MAMMKSAVAAVLGAAFILSAPARQGDPCRAAVAAGRGGGVPGPDDLRGARGCAPGDRVIIHGGIYRETVVVEASGTDENPILFEAAPAERVIVTGADLLREWRREDEKQQVFSTPWPHRFIGWNRTNAHPGDDYHLLIGRCEQVFTEHYALRQVLSRDKLSRGTFFADLEGQRLYVWTADNADLGKGAARVEASVRQCIWQNKGSHIRVRGLRFRYAANMAQRGAVLINGDHNELADCIIEYANSAGLAVGGARDVAIRRCVIQYNGQLGFGASHAHGLLISDCTIRGNSTKGWNRDWEAGGSKICLSRGVVVEHSRFIENRGTGLWFDIGNEDATVRNCLIADNEAAGIFYEISFGLHAHDNVIVGNGFDAGGGSWRFRGDCPIQLAQLPDRAEPAGGQQRGVQLSRADPVHAADRRRPHGGVEPRPARAQQRDCVQPRCAMLGMV